MNKAQSSKFLVYKKNQRMMQIQGKEHPKAVQSCVIKKKII